MSVRWRLLVVVGVEDSVANRAVEGSVMLHEHYVEHLVRGRGSGAYNAPGRLQTKPYVLQAATAGAAGSRPSVPEAEPGASSATASMPQHAAP